MGSVKQNQEGIDKVHVPQKSDLQAVEEESENKVQKLIQKDLLEVVKIQE